MNSGILLSKAQNDTTICKPNIDLFDYYHEEYPDDLSIPISIPSEHSLCICTLWSRGSIEFNSDYLLQGKFCKISINLHCTRLFPTQN